MSVLTSCFWMEIRTLWMSRLDYVTWTHDSLGGRVAVDRHPQWGFLYAKFRLFECFGQVWYRVVGYVTERDCIRISHPDQNRLVSCLASSRSLEGS